MLFFAHHLVIYKLKRFKVSPPPLLVHVTSCVWDAPPKNQQIQLQPKHQSSKLRQITQKHSTNREYWVFRLPKILTYCILPFGTFIPFFHWLWHTSNKNTDTIFRSPQGTDSKVSRKKEAKRVTLPKRMTRKRRRSRSTRVLARSVWLSLSWEKSFLPGDFWGCLGRL